MARWLLVYRIALSASIYLLPLLNAFDAGADSMENRIYFMDVFLWLKIFIVYICLEAIPRCSLMRDFITAVHSTV